MSPEDELKRLAEQQQQKRMNDTTVFVLAALFHAAEIAGGKRPQFEDVGYAIGQARAFMEAAELNGITLS